MSTLSVSPWIDAQQAVVIKRGATGEGNTVAAALSEDIKKRKKNFEILVTIHLDDVDFTLSKKGREICLIPRIEM